MDPLERADFGHMLQDDVVKKGLHELNPDLNFDLGARTNQAHPYITTRQGVFLKELHICSMDRGIIPEYKVWETTKRRVEIPWYAADREDASITYVEVLKDEPGYEDLYEIGLKGSDPQYMVNDKGKLLRLKAMGYEPVGRRCLRVGWRHTFERMLVAKIPGITRESLSDKFGVDMHKIPTGTQEELVAALAEE